MVSPSASIRLALVVAAYTVALSLYLQAVPGRATRPGFVFVAMVCVLGLAFVVAPIVPLRVPAPLRPIRNWEKRGRVYRALGVEAFGTLLRRTPLRLLNTRVYVQTSDPDPARVIAQLESAEASHLLSAVLTVPYMVYTAISGEWTTALAFVVAQLLVNLYPIAHTRMARGRMERMARMARRRDLVRAEAPATRSV